MTHQVLARRWRPRTFAEVVGQQHVTRALINALNNDRLHHAYLFTGTRGVGKTTLARILAKCFNCESGITATPCGTCSSCQAIDKGAFIDLIEVDAASRTKVEDTRELLENVQYAPTQGRFKIYLIDEVHMLSGHSFNALLKTLEEPPPHIKFLLATTDPQKLPITVLSRCLQFNLKNVAEPKITDYLANILDQEKITYEQPAIQSLARAADGSVRDALSLLDQAIAYGDNKITSNEVTSMLGSIENAYLYELLQALAKHDGNAILTIINNLAEHVIDFSGLLTELLAWLHKIAVIQTVPDVDYYEKQQLQTLSQLFSPEDVQLYYQIALIGRRDLPLAPSAKSGVEMTLLRMLAFQPVKMDSLVRENDRKDVKRGNDDLPVIPANEGIQKTDDWEKILAQLNLAPSTKALAAHCNLQQITDTQVTLILQAKHSPMLHDNHIERLTTAFSELLNQPMKVNIKIGDSTAATPNDKAVKKKNQQQKQAENIFTNNSNVQEIIDKFNAKIVAGSIHYNDNKEE